MTPPSEIGSGSGTFADKIPSCDLSSVDLRPFKDLPPSWLVIAPEPWAQDPSLVEGYEKLDRYFRIDDQKNGSGNGDRILHAEEIEAYKAVRGLRYGENTCSLMKEARQFSESAEEFKKKVPSVAKIEYGVFKFCSENDLFCSSIFSSLVLALPAILSLISQKKDKGPPPSDSGGIPSSGEKSGSSADETPEAHTTPVPIRSVETDLVGQIHQMYGGAVYTGLGSTTLFPLSADVKAPALSIIPLITPLPLTLPEVRPLPVLRPVPVTVAF
jgi:hypothetical protein